MLIPVSAVISSCQQEKQSVKAPEVKAVAELPLQMIKSPDGTLYFPENIHRPKSDRDSLVTVYPSDLK